MNSKEKLLSLLQELENADDNKIEKFRNDYKTFSKEYYPEDHILQDLEASIKNITFYSFESVNPANKLFKKAKKSNFNKIDDKNKKYNSYNLVITNPEFLFAV